MRLHGIGVKGPRSFMIQENLQSGTAFKKFVSFNEATQHFTHRDHSLTTSSLVLLTKQSRKNKRLLRYTKATQNVFFPFFTTSGDLSEYLKRNSSLLGSNPTELGNILNHVINGMVFLHESLVEHGELVRPTVGEWCSPKCRP